MKNYPYCLKLLFCLIYLTFSNISQANNSNNITTSSEDSLQLVALYNATNGAGWTPSSWDLNTPFSTWEGIDVNTDGEVTHIDLHGNNLSGTLPELCFPKLESLILNNNQLTGAIPDFDFPELIGLFLNENDLSGDIPNFNLLSLQALSLNSNNLAVCRRASH